MVQKKSRKVRPRAGLPPGKVVAHPLSRLGEVNKAFIITIITIVALVALALLLLYSDRIVGKAISFEEQIPLGEGGIFVVTGTEFEGRPIEVPIEANIGTDKSVAMSFSIAYETGLTPDCSDPSQIFEKLDIKFNADGQSRVVAREINCDTPGEIHVRYMGLCAPPLGADSCPNVATDKFQLGNIPFTGTTRDGEERSTYDITVTPLEIINLEGQQNLIAPAGISSGQLTIISQGTCQVDGDCQDSYCNLQTNRCVACLEDAHCSGTTPICDNNMCRAARCDGSAPQNADLCDNAAGVADDQELTADGTNVLIAACTEDTKCEYTCASGYTANAGVCELEEFSCTGDVPDTNAELCTNDDTGLTADTARTLVGTCTPNTKCEYRCGTGYELSGGACVAQQFACTGARPTNSVLCTDDDRDLTVNTGRTVVASCTTAAKCEYTCLAGYVQQGNNCILPEPETGFSFLITATADIPQSEAYITLRNSAQGTSLVFKKEIIPAMRDGETYLAIANYEFPDQVEIKEIQVRDKLPNEGWTVHGQLVVNLETGVEVPTTAVNITIVNR